MIKRRWSLLIPFMLVALAWSEPESRSVSGVVTDKRGNLLPGAVVQLDNTVTKQIQSFVVQKDGRYQFYNLNPDIEFVLHAQYRGRQSKAWTLSKFNDTRNIQVDFVIPID